MLHRPDVDLLGQMLVKMNATEEGFRYSCVGQSYHLPRFHTWANVFFLHSILVRNLSSLGVGLCYVEEI